MDGNSLIGEIRGYRKKRFERQVRKVGGEREKAVNLNKKYPVVARPVRRRRATSRKRGDQLADTNTTMFRLRGSQQRVVFSSEFPIGSRGTQFHAVAG
jgi:hypothetical protein